MMKVSYSYLIFVGDDKRVIVEAIGTFRLHLKIGFYLDLFETFVVLSFRKDLISISSLDISIGLTLHPHLPSPIPNLLLLQSFKLLSMASYSGQLLLDSSSP